MIVRGSRMTVVMLASAWIAGCGSTHKAEYRAAGNGLSAVKSTAVLPLENLTAMQDAGRVVADVLSTELAARDLEVVDRGKSEASLASVDMIPGGTVDRLAAVRLGEILGVDTVVFGSVSEARVADPGNGPRNAVVGLSLRLVDVKTGAYLLAGSYTASAGDDSITAAARKAAADFGEAVGK